MEQIDFIWKFKPKDENPAPKIHPCDEYNEGIFGYKIIPHEKLWKDGLWKLKEQIAQSSFKNQWSFLIKNSEGTPHQSVAPDNDPFSAVSKVSVETDVEWRCNLISLHHVNGNTQQNHGGFLRD